MTKFKFVAVVVLPMSAVVLASLVAGSPMRGAADDDEQGSESRIRQGFANAPLPLNLKGKNRALVGLGSYLVNVAGDGNGCHTSDQQNPYLPGGKPTGKD